MTKELHLIFSTSNKSIEMKCNFLRKNFSSLGAMQGKAFSNVLFKALLKILFVKLFESLCGLRKAIPQVFNWKHLTYSMKIFHGKGNIYVYEHTCTFKPSLSHWHYHVIIRICSVVDIGQMTNEYSPKAFLYQVSVCIQDVSQVQKVWKFDFMNRSEKRE